MQKETIHCQYHPPFHWGWGGFAEELFYYTSRYYFATEVFLRNIAEEDDFSMSGYKAKYLSSQQRELMAVVLSHQPAQHTASAVISIVSDVLRHLPEIDHELAALYRCEHEKPHDSETLIKRHYLQNHETPDVPPLDPFLNISERLQLPVAIRGHHVEVSLHLLASHLDSSSSTIRTNLQNAVLQLHNGGYILRNHPHLTHLEAHTIADDDAI